MNLLSLFSFTAFLVYLCLGIYSFRLNRESRLNRIFLFLSVCLAFWAFGAAFFYPAPHKEAAWFWFKTFSIGWYLFPPALFHFFLALTDFPSRKPLPVFWLAILYFPAIFAYFYTLTGIFVITDFQMTPYGWTPVYQSRSPFYLIFALYFVLLPLIGMILTARWMKFTRSTLKKTQGRIILYTLIPSFTAMIITGILLKLSGKTHLPPLAPILILIWMLGIAFAVSRYRLMILTPAIAAEEIIARISDLVFLTSPEGRVIHCNQTAEKLLNKPTHQILSRPFYDLFYESDTLKNLFHENNLNRGEKTFHFHLKTGSSEILPVQVSFSLFFEDAQENSLMGILITARDLRQISSLKQEVRSRKLAEQKLTALSEELEGQVLRRTAELEEERALLEQILNVLPHAVAICTPDGTLIRKNLAMEKLLNEIGHHDEKPFNILLPGEKKTLAEFFMEAEENKIPEGRCCCLSLTHHPVPAPMKTLLVLISGSCQENHTQALIFENLSNKEQALFRLQEQEAPPRT